MGWSSVPSGGGLSSPVGIADGGTGGTTQAAAMVALGIGDSGAWADFPNMQKVTLATQANSITNPPTDPVTGNAFVWNNSDHLDSASVTGGTLTLNHDATNTGFAAGPRLTTPLPARPGWARAIAVFVRGDATDAIDADNETVSIVSETSGDGATEVSQFGLRQDAGALSITHFDDGSLVKEDTTVTAANFTDGVWLLMWETNPGISTRVATAYLKDGAKGTPPAWDDWVMTGNVGNNQAGQPLDPRDFGIQMNTANTNDDLIGHYDAIWIGYV